MAVADSHLHHRRRGKSQSEGKIWRLCTPWQSGATAQSSSASSTQVLHQHQHGQSGRLAATDGSDSRSSPVVTVKSVARSLLPARRRLRLDPAKNLYFPYEPGKQVRSAVRIKNASKSHVAFKFQTTAPKSCYMRPPGGVLAPEASLIATVFKFVEQPENNEKQLDQKSKVKFRIMSLKVTGGTEYVPELFDEQKHQVVVERTLRVVFLDVERPTAVSKLALECCVVNRIILFIHVETSSIQETMTLLFQAMEKLRRQLSEAEASPATSRCS